MDWIPEHPPSLLSMMHRKKRPSSPSLPYDSRLNRRRTLSTTQYESGEMLWTDDIRPGNASSALYNARARRSESSNILACSEQSLGDAPAFPSDMVFVPRINSVEKALEQIQEITTHADVHPAVQAIRSWASNLKEQAGDVPGPLQEFRAECATYPRLVWGPKRNLQLPQMTYDQLRSRLVHEMPTSSMKNLKAAHLFAIVWAKLFHCGVLTRQMYDAACLLLWENRDIARLDILDTLITSLIDAAGGLDKCEDPGCLAQLLVDVKKVKARFQERQDAKSQRA